MATILNVLVPEIALEFLHHLDPVDLGRLSMTCKPFHKLITAQRDKIKRIDLTLAFTDLPTTPLDNAKKATLRFFDANAEHDADCMKLHVDVIMNTSKEGTPAMDVSGMVFPDYTLQAMNMSREEVLPMLLQFFGVLNQTVDFSFIGVYGDLFGSLATYCHYKNLQFSSIDVWGYVHHPSFAQQLEALLKKSKVKETFRFHSPMSLKPRLLKAIREVKECDLQTGWVHSDESWSLSDIRLKQWNPNVLECHRLAPTLTHKAILAWIVHPERKIKHKLSLAIRRGEGNRLLAAMDKYCEYRVATNQRALSKFFVPGSRYVLVTVSAGKLRAHQIVTISFM